MTQPEDQTIGPRLEAIRIRDALCDSFEQELLRGEKPKLDTYLAKADPRDRLQLLPELLALSRHHLSETGMRELLKEYLAQNPEHSNTIIDILRDETLNMEVTSMQVGTLCEQSKPGLYPGGTFGKFEILEEIARGGMGVIFKARQKDLDRVVALKVIISGRLASAEEIRRFEREACSVAALEHRNIISIYEVNQIDNLHYFTMKYFDGRDLNTWAKESSPSLTEKLNVLIQLSEGIGFAHQRGIIHRDLKPGNILVNQQGLVQIVDFGLSKEVDGMRTAITGEKMVGTPLYMSPEQLFGNRSQCGVRSDIYAIGAVMYELLTHQKPYIAKTLFELIQQVQSVTPIDPSTIDSQLPVKIDDICRRCLAKKPANRFASAFEIADDLRQLIQKTENPVVPGTVQANLPTGKPKYQSASQSFQVFAWSSLKTSHLIFLALLTFAGSVSLWIWTQKDPPNSTTNVTKSDPEKTNRNPIQIKGLLPDLAADSVPNQSTNTPDQTLNTIFDRLNRSPRFSVKLDLQNKTELKDIFPDGETLSIYLYLELSTPVFQWDDASGGDFPTIEEAVNDPLAITKEHASFIRGEFELPFQLTLFNSSGVLIEQLERSVVWNDGRGAYEKEAWNPQTKNVDVILTTFLHDVNLGNQSEQKITVKFEFEKTEQKVVRVVSGKLLAY